jgi:hypothetical protein
MEQLEVAEAALIPKEHRSLRSRLDRRDSLPCDVSELSARWHESCCIHCERPGL